MFSQEQLEDLIQSFQTSFMSGERYDNIVQARKQAETFLGQPIRAGSPISKQVEEAIESSLIEAAKQLIQRSTTTGEAFDRLVDLYDRQPNLSVRSSKSIAQQAYSTPLPIAYLAAVIAGVTPEQTVYEPTAGHGALILDADPSRAIVNELNQERANQLRRQGYTVTQHDASLYLPDQQVDIVIMNPPFGVVREQGTSREWMVRGGAATQPYRTTQIDHAIALHGLQAMKNDGRAVLVLGAPMAIKTGNLESASNTLNSGQKRAFYKNLYDNYRVVESFFIAGDLYKRQGTTFPIHILAIEGRGRSERFYPAAEPPLVYTTFDQLKEQLPDVPRQTLRLDASDRRFDDSRVNDRIELRRHTDSPSQSVHGTAIGSSGVDDSASRAERGELPEPDRAGAKSSSDLPDSDSRYSRAERVGADADAVQFRASGANEPNFSDRESGDNDSRISADDAARSDRDDRTNSLSDAERLARANDRSAAFPRLTPIESSFEIIMNPENLESEVQSDITQVEYKPHSGATPVGTLVPANMQTAVENALKRLEARVGAIDDYVADRLGIDDRTTLYQRYSAEQVDALGLAISNLEKNEAFIIGDQTGVGKGRFVAGIIEYARRQELTPIFVTQDPKLYGDIIRDLHDVGVDDLVPIPTNNNIDVPLPNGKTLKTSGAAQHKALLNSMTVSEDLGSNNAIFTTYSQMQTVNGERTHRHDFLRQFAPKSILIFDESHNAGGTPDRDGDASGRAGFVRDLVARSGGVVYSSATYAKNPFTMTLYSIKTGMRHAVDNPENLVPMIQSGKVPLQQAIAAELTRSGQYIRRERSYEGIEFGARVAPVDRQVADNLSFVMSQIMQFDEAKQQALKELARESKKEAKQISTDNSTGAAGATSTNFTSLMHNVINQTLLALKAEAAVQEALSSLSRNEKPVITVANTMGSFIGDAAEAQDLKPGDPIDLNVGDLLRRYLESSRMVIIKEYDGKSTRRPLTDAELAGEALDRYEECLELIEDVDWSDLPVSPIDYIRYRLEQEGYRTNEITGRKDCIEYGPDGSQSYRVRTSGETSTKAAIAHVDQFNSGELDVMILNRSGATGISLHASEKFSDQRPRHMIIAQAELNIDQFMQMLGRIHRTGQVENPSFTILMGDTPAEKRPAAVLLKKMASLNANTTAARESGFSLGEVTDFMNEYGDQVALELLATQPGLNRQLGSPVKGLDEESELDYFETEGLINKFTGRIPLLSIAQQERVYTLLEREYTEYAEREAAMGQSILQAERLDLDATTLARMQVLPAKEGYDSPFTAAAYVEVIDAKAQRKPMTQLEVVNAVRSHIGLETLESLDNHYSYSFKQSAKKYAVDETKTIAQQVKSFRNQQKAGLEAKQPSSSETEDPTAKTNKVAKLEQKLERQYSHVAGTMRRFYPGQPVRIVTNKNVFYGVVGQYLNRSSEGGNPTLPSSWSVQIELADAARQITVPLSKVNTGRMNAITLDPTETTLIGNDIYELFDQKQSLSRENRQIFTGNVIRAFEQFPDGKLVSFTDSKGGVRQGLLMCQGFDIGQVLEERPVRMPSPEACLQFWSSASGSTALKTEDDFLKVWSNAAGMLTLSAERSKSKGGKYYLDEDLMNAAQAEFVSLGKTLQLTVEPGQADAVLQYLYDSGKALYAFDERSKAREMLGIELPALETIEDATAALLEELPAYVEELEHPAKQIEVVSRLEALLGMEASEPVEVSNFLTASITPEASVDEVAETVPDEFVLPAEISADALPPGKALAAETVDLELGQWGKLTSTAIEFEDFLYLNVQGLTANYQNYPDGVYVQCIPREEWLDMDARLHDLKNYAQFAAEERYSGFQKILSDECDRIAPDLKGRFKSLDIEEIQILSTHGEARKSLIEEVLQDYPSSDRVEFNADFRALAIATVTDKFCVERVQEYQAKSIQSSTAIAQAEARLPSPPEAHSAVTRILLPAQQVGKPEKNIARFLDRANLAEAVLGGDDNSFHLRIKNEPYLPLVIERHRDELYFTHYIERNGELIHDGEMIFKINDGHLKLSSTAVQDWFRGGELRACDRSFASLFSSNILAQDFAEAAKTAYLSSLATIETTSVTTEQPNIEAAHPESMNAASTIEIVPDTKETDQSESVGVAPTEVPNSEVMQDRTQAVDVLIENHPIENQLIESEATSELDQAQFIDDKIDNTNNFLEAESDRFPVADLQFFTVIDFLPVQETGFQAIQNDATSAELHETQILPAGSLSTEPAPVGGETTAAPLEWEVEWEGIAENISHATEEETRSSSVAVPILIETSNSDTLDIVSPLDKEVSPQVASQTPVTLQDLRDWYRQARDVGKTGKHLERIEEIGKAFRFEQQPLNERQIEQMGQDKSAWRTQAETISTQARSILEREERRENLANGVFFRGKQYTLFATDDLLYVTAPDRGVPASERDRSVLPEQALPPKYGIILKEAKGEVDLKATTITNADAERFEKFAQRQLVTTHQRSRTDNSHER